MTAVMPVKWHPATSKSEEPYLVYQGEAWRLAVDAQAVEFEGFRGYDLFSHKIDGGYRVSERSTGLALVRGTGGRAETFYTRGTALGAASAWLGQVGPVRFAESVVLALQAREARREIVAEKLRRGLSEGGSL